MRNWGLGSVLFVFLIQGCWVPQQQRTTYRAQPAGCGPFGGGYFSQDCRQARNEARQDSWDQYMQDQRQRRNMRAVLRERSYGLR